ncbi:hypothetical protein [Oricola thermophila]|uniref:GlsB/YeaQ/YmgE family stress response membrane protein n=1 Tax=Oricola thermophila TaxID=2742145 RepID=A0A6N1VKJ4_9HYPH|nr:hypothetical protein [Oricola thermophila]QKV20285.1 hypothetical protein HTY61_18415 [Oricola thermophila]
MLTSMDTVSLLVLGLAIAAGAYFIAAAMDGVMGPDGFGTVPNMVILIAGSFLGLYATEYLHLPAYSTTSQAVVGVSGAFSCLAFLAVLKSLANRFGY